MFQFFQILVHGSDITHLQNLVSDNASVKQELTPVFENFRQELEKVDAEGDTAVYDALDQARGLLVNFRKDLPALRRRIIIVSDGDDTSSDTTARGVCKALVKNSIVVDSVQVGKEHNTVLHAISVATGMNTYHLSCAVSLMLSSRRVSLLPEDFSG